MKIENILMIALVVCAFYYLMGNCGCKEGFQQCPNNFLDDNQTEPGWHQCFGLSREECENNYYIVGNRGNQYNGAYKCELGEPLGTLFSGCFGSQIAPNLLARCGDISQYQNSGDNEEGDS